MERHLVSHCAPTLAGIKTANLFNYGFSSIKALYRTVYGANKLLNPRGVYAEILNIRRHCAQLYVYRKSRLAKDLSQKGAREFLARYGYGAYNINDCIAHLKERYSGYDEFPHEIGIFLGYPLQDVIAFIDNGGKNCKCVGCWKVYCNENEASRIFESYQNCKNAYIELFYQGEPIERLIASV